MGVSRWIVTAVGLVLAGATGLLALVGFASDASHRRSDRADAQRAAVHAFRGELEETVESARELAGLYAASDEVTSEEFETFARPLLEQVNASGFGWVQPVTAAQRARFERESGLRVIEPGAGGKLVPAASRASYYVLTQHVSRKSSQALGLDVGLDALRRTTLERARATQTPQATSPRSLATGQRAIIVYAPVIDRGGVMRGAASGVFPLDRLAASIAAVMPRAGGFALRLGKADVARGGDLHDPQRRLIELGGQRWELLTSPAPAGRMGYGPLALLVGGLVIGLALAVLLQLLAQAERARRLASARTRERDAAESRRRTMQTRFERAFDSGPVAMALLDRTGRALQVNQALAELSGYPIAALLDMAPAALLDPDDVPHAAALMAQFTRGERDQFAGQACFRHASGREFWAAVHITALADDSSSDAPLLVHLIDVTDQRRVEAELKHMADHDPLTGLLNRRGFECELERHVAHVGRYGAAGALLVLDLDHFKSVNDTLGHGVGDQLLTVTAQILRSCLRETDVIARLGGDEFAVLIPREDADEARCVARKIAAEIRERGVLFEQPITTSIGVATFQDDADAEQMLTKADLAMYDAKEAGRDGHALYDPSESRTRARLGWLVE